MRLLLGLMMLGTFSCQTVNEPSVATSDISPPEAWAAAKNGQHGKISTGWLKEFKSPRMNQLVREALKNNQNLKRLAYQLRAAKEGMISGRAERLPSLTTSSSANAQDRGPESFSLQLNTRWEVDLWGRLRNRDLARQANFAATIADYRGARLSLAANTARTWSSLVTAERQLDLAIATLDSYKRALPAVERGYLATTLRSVDLQFARSNIANAERSIRQRRLARDNAARSLEIFLGRYPSSTVTSSTKLPELPQKIPAGIPALLLERRPDLIAARARLFASAQNAEATRKNLLPNLNLNAGANNGSTSLSRAFDPTQLAYNTAASLAQTIYRGGQLNAQTKQALAQNRAAIESYVQAVLAAFNEVESALAADTSLREQEVFLTQEVKQTTSAETRTLRDITLGVPGASFLDYLEAQRRAEIARASLIQLRNTRLQNRIDLHLALGGDFFTKTP